ncbi:hypothetical protein GQ600_24401 [Phytophthora cactorum]|nr:hypothetical protein GQ600_24401 [Phytophthora cactorum]
MYLHLWCEQRGSGRSFALRDNEDDKSKEMQSDGKKEQVNRKRQKLNERRNSADSVAALTEADLLHKKYFEVIGSGLHRNARFGASNLGIAAAYILKHFADCITKPEGQHKPQKEPQDIHDVERCGKLPGEFLASTWTYSAKTKPAATLRSLFQVQTARRKGLKPLSHLPSALLAAVSLNTMLVAKACGSRPLLCRQAHCAFKERLQLAICSVEFALNAF